MLISIKSCEKNKVLNEQEFKELSRSKCQFYVYFLSVFQYLVIFLVAAISIFLVRVGDYPLCEIEDAKCKFKDSMLVI